MIKNGLGKVMWVGRATVFCVGLAVILALVLGVATTAIGATGGNFILGRSNVATTVSTLSAKISAPALNLVNTSTGAAATALNITVATGKPPLKVNAAAGKATNLNADKIDNREASSFANGVAGKATDADNLDGIDSTSFLGSTAKAQDSDKLDGKDSTNFYAAGSKVADSARADQATTAGNADTVDGKHAADFYATGSKAADSELLDGKDSNQFVQGRGTAAHGTRALNPGEFFIFMTTPEITLSYQCPASDISNINGLLRVRNGSSTETVNLFSDNGGTNPNHYGSLAPNAAFDQPTAASGELVTFGVQGTYVATVEVFSVHRASDNKCHVQAQSLVTR